MNRGRMVLRAYNMGFGDSFLVSSYKDQHRHDFLIDLGTKVGCSCGTPFSQVIDDVNERLSTKPLDILIISHTHRDHIRGLCPSNNNPPVFDQSPREIWVPKNCDPAYGPRMSYGQLTDLDRCRERLQSLAKTLIMTLRVTYHIDVDDCITKIEELYPDSEICYVDNQTQIHRVNGFDGEFTLDILNPPTAPALLIKALLDLVPVDIMRKCNIPPTKIRMIKDFSKVPFEYEQEDIKIRATQEDYESLYEMREDTLSQFDYGEIPLSKSKIEEIDIDDTTVKAIRRIVDLVFNGIDDKKLKEREIHAFHNLLNQLDEIDYINGFMAERAIEKVEGRIANDFSIATQVRWQGRVFLFPGDLLNWNNIKHRIHSLDFLKIPHHGGFGNYLEDHELLSRMFPTNGSVSVIPTCFPDASCSTINSRPDPRRTFHELCDYSTILFTSNFSPLYHDFVFSPE